MATYAPAPVPKAITVVTKIITAACAPAGGTGGSQPPAYGQRWPRSR